MFRDRKSGLILPDRFRSKHRQRGMLSGMGVRRQVYSGPSYSLDAGNGGTVSVIDGASPFNSYVGIRFLSTGFVQIAENTDGGPSWSAHGQWISDTGEITGNEEVRFTNMSTTTGTGDFSTEASADDVWIALTATREYYRNRTVGGQNVFSCDFEVRDTVAGIPTGSQSYTFDLDNVI